MSTDYTKNTYGYLRRDVTEPRDGLDMAVGATSTAAAGAQALSGLGPIGTGVGAVGGYLYGMANQQNAQLEEQAQERSDIANNKFVSNLEGRGPRQQIFNSMQARYGMNNQRYSNDIVEIEGDGSRDPVDGIGEIHTDENYNIKNMATGAPTHEEGGMKIPNAEKGMKVGNELANGDIIFPWQKDPAKYEKGMRMIKRYKLNGDPRAKKWLDREVERLPTEKDYDRGNKEYPDGKKGGGKSTKSNIPLGNDRAMGPQYTTPSGFNFDDQPAIPYRDDYEQEEIGFDTPGETDLIPPMFDEDEFDYGNGSINDLIAKVADEKQKQNADKYAKAGAEEAIGQSGKGGPTESENAASIASNDTVDKKNNPTTTPQTNTGGNVVSGEGSVAKKQNKTPSYKIVSDYDKDWDYRLNEETGRVDVRRKGSTKWNEPNEAWNKKNQNVGDTEAPQTNMEITRKRVFGDWSPSNTESADVEEDVTAGDISPVYKEPQSKGMDGDGLDDEGDDTGTAKSDDEGDGEGEGNILDELSDIQRRSNPLEYANILRNFTMGAKEADKVTRRYMTPEQLKYEDRSYAQRQAIDSAAAAARLGGRGKGLTFSQTQSQQGQIQSKAAGQHERVNEAEARRADKVGEYNVGAINKAGGMNTQMAVKYDEMDDRNLAAKEAFTSQGTAELARKAQLDTQARYMMDRNDRQYEVAKFTANNIGTENFGLDKDLNVQYIKGTGEPIDGHKGRGFKHTVNKDGSVSIGDNRYFFDGKQYHKIN